MFGKITKRKESPPKVQKPSPLKSNIDKEKFEEGLIKDSRAEFAQVAPTQEIQKNVKYVTSIYVPENASKKE